MSGPAAFSTDEPHVTELSEKPLFFQRFANVGIFYILISEGYLSAYFLGKAMNPAENHGKPRLPASRPQSYPQKPWTGFGLISYPSTCRRGGESPPRHMTP
ncbi:MAG: hypothetical protein JJT95_18125 [Pararhodobacter sp.]|nr:hypothetical protein [Pararhodobacter sp.]